MVLQTLLKDLPSEAEPTPVPHTPESAAAAEHDEVLSSLLDFGAPSQPATAAVSTAAPAEPPPPPECPPMMELPVERPFGNGLRIAPRHVSAEWVDGFYGVELGEYATPFAPEPLFQGAPIRNTPAPSFSTSDDAPPLAEYIVTLVAPVGSYRAIERVEPIALRRGVRPSFASLTGPDATRIRWDAPKKVLPPREAIALPTTPVAHPPDASDLQDSLVDMLVNMVDA